LVGKNVVSCWCGKGGEMKGLGRKGERGGGALEEKSVSKHRQLPERSVVLDRKRKVSAPMTTSLQPGSYDRQNPWKYGLSKYGR